NAYHEAAESGNIELIKLVQDAGGNPLSRDAHGTTPFSLVILKGDNVIKAVLGTNSRLIDSDGNTPLHIAIEKKADPSVLSLLLSMNYPVNTRNREGIIPLVIAAKNGMKEHVQLLIEQGADIYLTDNSGECALSIALTKQTALLDSMVKYAGKKVDIAGEGILHYAARLADISTLQKVLGMGLDRQSRNISGETPRDIAVRWQKTEAAELLR
ncbi:MAG TPA: ankyrin repeat domain-containing protein, partial [Treponemataceae bacterium]|nr:ankyrin repeat domain-containing protein [Treponemataceae bacterium]